MSRRFVFIDESGDPGHASRYFIVAAVDVDRASLGELRRLMSPYRHHNNLFGEMKTAGLNPSKRPFVQACELCCSLLGIEGVGCTVAFVDKTAYTGPYLGRNGTSVRPVKFRNFITRLTLESHFAEYPVIGQTELELVFDRISLSPDDRANLEWYLRTNQRLPTVTEFCHVDSDYVDAVFLPDMAATVVKNWLRGDEGDAGMKLREMFNSMDLTTP